MAASATCRVRLSRWIGLDRNPLRRTSDRIEAWITVLLMVAFVPLAVLVTVQVGRWVYASGMRDQAARRVPAVALAPARVANPEYGVPEMLWVPARWRIGDATRTGQAQVPYGTAKGARVRIWIGQDGHPITSPATPSQTRNQEIAAMVMSPLMLAEALTFAWGGLHWLLDRRRLAAWGTEWQSFDRQQARP